MIPLDHRGEFLQRDFLCQPVFRAGIPAASGPRLRKIL
jgi:hypothetical protein